MAFLGNVRALGREPLPRPRRSSWWVFAARPSVSQLYTTELSSFYFSFVEKHNTLGMSTEIESLAEARGL